MQTRVLRKKPPVLVNFAHKPASVTNGSCSSWPTGVAAGHRAPCHGGDSSSSPFCMFFLDVSAYFPYSKLRIAVTSATWSKGYFAVDRIGRLAKHPQPDLCVGGLTRSGISYVTRYQEGVNVACFGLPLSTKTMLTDYLWTHTNSHSFQG